MTEQELSKQEQARQAQRALEDAEALDGENRLKDNSRFENSIAGQVMKNFEDKERETRAAMPGGFGDIVNRVKNDVDDMIEKKSMSRYDVDLTSNIKEPEAETEDEDVYPGRRRYM